MTSLSRAIKAVREHGDLQSDRGTLITCGLIYLFLMAGGLYMILTQPDGARFIIILALAPMLAIAQTWWLVTGSLRKLRESEMWADYHQGREAYLVEVRAEIAANPKAMPEDVAMRGYDMVHRPFYS